MMQILRKTTQRDVFDKLTFQISMSSFACGGYDALGSNLETFHAPLASKHGCVSFLLHRETETCLMT